MKRSTKIAAVTTAAGVAASAAVSYTITRKLVELAIYREKPKKLEKQRPKVSRTRDTDEFLAYADKCAAELAENSNIITVGIPSRDGIHLAGHWYPCENAKRIIVAMHGWRSAWNYDFSMIADFWHREGCSILFAEQRGQNNSGGNYITFGHLERYDCLDWVNFIEENNCVTILGTCRKNFLGNYRSIITLKSGLCDTRYINLNNWDINTIKQ